MSNDLRTAAQVALPCPFCGGAPETPVRTYYVRCSGCLAEGPYERGPHEVAPTEAIDAWNRRAALAEPVQEPDYWQEEARRYAGNADYWRKRYEALAQPAAPDPMEGTAHKELGPPRPLVYATTPRAALTPREIELIDGMIKVQLNHANQCDGIRNRTMAEKQKGWDMERVELLRKLRSGGPRDEPV